MEPWEALDLDDSDLPSILRPCKRHQSQLSQVSLSNPNFSSQRCAPTPPPPVDNHPPLSSRCPIPGPAGAMQTVMDRVCHRNEDFSRSRDAKISTQDYIKMVEEDDAEEFTSDHWLSALDFLSREGAIRTSSLNDVKNCVNTEKIDMVVAMIKCCTPNGLGDMTVVLKDPTDTVSASIHRKVLTEGDYGKQIAVGSVLILQQVSVFSSLNKSHYLNISLSNVVKVVPKDAGREIYSLSTAKEDAPEHCKSSKAPEQVSLGPKRTTKASQLNFSINATQSSIEKHVREKNIASGNQTNADQNSKFHASLQQLFKGDRAAGSNIMKEPIEVDLLSSSQECSTEKMASISGCIQPDTDLRDAENLGDEGMSAAAQVQVQSTTGIRFENLEKEDLGHEKSVETQQVKRNAPRVERLNEHAGQKDVFEKINNLTPSKASFQQWTDDQLDILDMDD